MVTACSSSGRPTTPEPQQGAVTRMMIGEPKQGICHLQLLSQDSSHVSRQNHEAANSRDGGCGLVMDQPRAANTLPPSVLFQHL